MSAFFDFIWGIIQLGIFLALILGGIALWGYNRLRRAAENVKESWSNIGVVTRKKIGLVNQLIDVAKSYEANEKLIMLKVSQDLSVAAVQSTYQSSGTILSTVNGMAQRFPDMKADVQYREVMNAMNKTEQDLENARMRYNSVAKEFNVTRTSIPHVFYSAMLGFSKAQYLELEAVESDDAAVQRSMISDDGERINVLLGAAGNKMMGAAKTIAEQGKQLAEQGKALTEKGAAHLQARLAAGEEFHYLDADKSPQGPVTREQLMELFQQGAVTMETDILPGSSKTWTKYSTLQQPPVA